MGDKNKHKCKQAGTTCSKLHECHECHFEDKILDQVSFGGFLATCASLSEQIQNANTNTNANLWENLFTQGDWLSPSIPQTVFMQMQNSLKLYPFPGEMSRGG